MPRPITSNTLFYGDNLPILRERILGGQTFKQAEKVKKSTGKQGELGI
ncbi:MAG: hypothetical protein AB1750_00790 [Chloroflexota bacterium]